MKGYDPVGIAKVLEQHMGGCQGGMSAELHLPVGREPANGVLVIFFHCKGGLREPVFTGDLLHGFVGKPNIKDAYRCRVSPEQFWGKCIHLVNLLSHFVIVIVSLRAISRVNIVSSNPEIKQTALYKLSRSYVMHHLAPIPGLRSPAPLPFFHEDIKLQKKTKG